MTDPVQLAHASGRGTGRFLQQSLEDSLQNRSFLTEVRYVWDGHRQLVEFLFVCDGLSAIEIIRCRLADNGRPEHVVISMRAELCGDMHAHPDADDLEDWLGDNGRISVMSLEPHGRLRIRSDRDDIAIHCRLDEGEHSGLRAAAASN